MLQLVTTDLARELVLEHTRTLRSRLLPLEEATGLVLAETIRASEFGDHPLGGIDLRRGMEISGLMVGLLAASGRPKVKVVSRPTLSVIAVDVEHDEGWIGRPHQTGSMLGAMARCLGPCKPGLLDAFNTLEDLSFIMDHVSQADIVLLVGDLTEGGDELLLRTLKEINASVVFHDIAQQPGGSMILATRGSRLIFGLPSEPSAAVLCFDHYVAPAINKMMGRTSTPRWTMGKLAIPLEVQSELTSFWLAATLSHGNGFEVTPLLNGNRPGLANTYLQLPPGEHTFPQGAEVKVQWIDGLGLGTGSGSF